MRPTRAGLVVLLSTALVAFAVRAWYVEAHPPILFAGNDNTWYDAVARSFAHGDWGRVPGPSGDLVFSARFPPGYPLVAAVGQRALFWLPPERAHLYTSVLLGTAGAVLTAALAWRLACAAQPRTRIAVAAVAGFFIACNPLVVGASAALMSEVLILPLVAAFLLLVDLATADSPRRRTWVLLSAVLVAATFTRGEGLLFLGVPVLALVLVHRRSPTVRKGLLATLGIAVLCALAWSTLLSTTAGRPVLMSTNSGSLVLGANCPTTLHGTGRGSWDVDCVQPPTDRLSPELAAALKVPPRSAFVLAPQLGTELEAELSQAELREALDRIEDDPGASLAVVPYRWARGVGLIAGSFESKLTAFEGRDTDLEHDGQRLQQFVVLPLVVLLLIALAWRRSRLGSALRSTVAPAHLVPAAFVVGTWIVMLAVTYGSARFRQPVEPIFAVTCGLAVGTVVEAIGRKRDRGSVLVDSTTRTPSDPV